MVASEQEIGKLELGIKKWALPVSKCHVGHGLGSLDPNTGLIS